MTDISAQAAFEAAPDDIVSAFQIEGLPVRGRAVRLGAAVDEVLTRHDKP
jgi:molecular chaperone Hsp33